MCRKNTSLNKTNSQFDRARFNQHKAGQHVHVAQLLLTQWRTGQRTRANGLIRFILTESVYQGGLNETQFLPVYRSRNIDPFHVLEISRRSSIFIGAMLHAPTLHLVGFLRSMCYGMLRIWTKRRAHIRTTLTIFNIIVCEELAAT